MNDDDEYVPDELLNALEKAIKHLGRLGVDTNKASEIAWQIVLLAHEESK